MAMVGCPECKNEVSSSAATCPKCGHTLKKATRSLMGSLIKWTFIGFNLLMLYWMVAGVGAAAETIDTAESEAARAGAAAGTAIGAGIIIFIWAAGDVILGLFVLMTRPRVR